jgi:hypothetical protein
MLSGFPTNSDMFQQMPIDSRICHGETASLHTTSRVANPVTILPIDPVENAMNWPAQQESNLRPTA